jgi:sucrose-6-phosphate hydrolase SacC (GH32 family)
MFMIVKEFDLAKIRTRNVETEYPSPVVSPRWIDPSNMIIPGSDQSPNEKYRFPKGDFLKNGFAPPSLTMTDFSVILHEGLFHIFGTAAAPGSCCVWEGQHNYIFHASTSNFIEWELHRVALYNDPENTFEEAHVWPPYVFRYKDNFVMIYCGLDINADQCLCIARSGDLFTWKRDKANPVIDPSKLPWTYKNKDGKSRHCRDPHVELIDNKYFLYYTAYSTDKYSAVGLAVSSDTEHWEDLGPCFKRDASKANWLTESPLLIPRKSKYYLIPSQSPGVTCFASDDPTNFHHAEEIPVTGLSKIWAPELIDTSIEDSYLIGFYKKDAPEDPKLYLGRMDWHNQSINISGIFDKDGLKPWGYK